MALSSGVGVALGAAVTFDRFARHSLIQLASLIQLLLLGPCAVTVCRFIVARMHFSSVLGGSDSQLLVCF